MLLQAAINGARPPSEHPTLPTEPAQLAAAAKDCVAAGADSVHFHVRAPDVLESLESAAVARALTPVRSACRGTPVGISTGAWIEPDPDRRLALVRKWHALPDFASVNFHEFGAVGVAEELLDRCSGRRSAAEAMPASGWRIRCGFPRGRPHGTTKS